MPEFRILEDTEALVLASLSGRLDLEGIRRIEPGFSVQLGARHKPVAIDLSGLTFIASLGIGIIVSVAKGLHARGAGVVLVGPQPLVEKALRTAAIDVVIPIVPDLVEARRRLGTT